jgi:hypothetical protein
LSTCRPHGKSRRGKIHELPDLELVARHLCLIHSDGTSVAHLLLEE